MIEHILKAIAEDAILESGWKGQPITTYPVRHLRTSTTIAYGLGWGDHALVVDSWSNKTITVHVNANEFSLHNLEHAIEELRRCLRNWKGDG